MRGRVCGKVSVDLNGRKLPLVEDMPLQPLLDKEGRVRKIAEGSIAFSLRQGKRGSGLSSVQRLSALASAAQDAIETEGEVRCYLCV